MGVLSTWTILSNVGYVTRLEIMTAYPHAIRFGVTTVWIWINWNRSAALSTLFIPSWLGIDQLNLIWLRAIFCPVRILDNYCLKIKIYSGS